MRFNTKHLARHKIGWYLTVVRMDWLIAERRQESFVSRAIKGRGDYPNSGPYDECHAQIDLLDVKKTGKFLVFKGNRRRSIGYCPHLCKAPMQPFQPAQQSPRL